jgi:endonuclease/exonuclease/phosphatase family metal-dependent hydrolase
VPRDAGFRVRFRWDPVRLAAASALVAATAVVVAVKLVGSHGASSATPTASVVTAPVSTAATPSVGSVARRLAAPELRASVSPRRAGCQARRLPALRVLQFNIRAGISGTGDVDPSEIAAEIESVHPDLVSLNEVDSDTRRTRVDEPAYLAGATGLHAVYGPNLIYDGGPFGNAILTRYPVIESRNLRLPVSAGLEPRGLLTAIVRVDGRRVAFSSTHLSDGSDGRQSRTLQAVAVARALHSTGAPTIVAGDLNAVPTDLPVRILRRHLLDAQDEGGTGPGDTIPQADPSSRFDYILYDHHFAVAPGSTRVRASASSDHRSVVTTLTLFTRHGC